MVGSERQTSKLMAILAGAALLAVAVLALAGARQAAAADTYTLENFTGCSEGSTRARDAASGSWDDAGNLYIPCGDPSTIRVYDSSGVLQRSIPLDFVVSDVAPSPDGAYLYVARINSKLTRLARQQDGSYAVNASWSLASYNAPDGQRVEPRGLFIATDGTGDIYLADGIFSDANRGDVNTVVKYAANGDFVTRFGQKQNLSWADGVFHHSLTGLVASRDGSKVYTTENGNNRVQRWDRQANGSYSFHSKFGGSPETDPNRIGGPEEKQCQSWSVNPTFAAPYDVGLDGAGNVYVLNTSCRQVLKFTDNGNGTYSFVASSGTLRRTDGSLTVAPHGFAVAKNGNVYIGQSGKMMRLPAQTNTAPTISNLSPTDGSEITDRRPTMSATVEDLETNLQKSNVELHVDGVQIDPSRFGYDAATDRIWREFEPGDPDFAYGTHTVRVEATDAGNLTTTKSWSFTVVQPPPPATPDCDKWASVNGNDNNSGATQASPVRRVAKLISILDPGQTGCLVAGQTFNEPSGTFIVGNAGGTEGNPVTITSSGQPRANINAQMWLQTSSHDIVFKNLNFIGSPGLDRSVMLDIQGDRIKFEDNEVTFGRGHCFNVGLLNGENAVPTHQPTKGFVLDGNRIHDCGTDLGFAGSGEHAVYLKYTQGARITNNYIYDNNVHGVQLYPRADGTLVEHNVIDGNSGNLNIGSFPSAGAFSRNNVVRDNIITNATFLHDNDTAQVHGNYPVGTTDTQYGNVVTENCLFPVYGGEQRSDVNDANFSGYGYRNFANVFQNPMYENRAAKDFDIPANSPCAGKGPQTTVDPDPNDNPNAPTITDLSPANGSQTTNRRPRISATVRDTETNLQKSDVKLFVDGVEKNSNQFAYNSATDELSRVFEDGIDPDFAYGLHTVRIEATDAGGRTAQRSWSFRVRPPDTVKPTITGFSPRHNSRIKVRRPVVAATVSDNITNLSKAHITLKVNGKAVPKGRFAYNAANDRLTYKPPTLGFRRYTVQIIARDAANNVAPRSWSFVVVKKPRR